MISCPVCQHRELEGELFCAECGARLVIGLAETGPATAFINTTRLREVFREPPKPIPRDPEATNLALVFDGEPAPLVLTGRTEFVLGREGHATIVPDLNLSPYGAKDKGVSRVHAALRRDNDRWVVVDLGSTNGTRLNGTRLNPQEPVPVASGDEVCLGRLAFRISFVR